MVESVSEFHSALVLVAAAESQAAKRIQDCIKLINSQTPQQQRLILNARDSSGRSAMHYAALNDDQGLLSFLLSHPIAPDPNVADGQGQTPLHLALKGRHAAAAKLLLNSPVTRINLSDEFGRLPLHWAAQAGYTSLLPLCLDKPNNATVFIDSQTQGGDTALHWAVSESHLSTADYLLSHGANVLSKNKRDETPLSMAAIVGGEMKLLLEAFLPAATAKNEISASDTMENGAQSTTDDLDKEGKNAWESENKTGKISGASSTSLLSGSVSSGSLSRRSELISTQPRKKMTIKLKK